MTIDGRVSVIVPSYNHESFIGDCLSSIYEQTHEDVELIIIDDNSPDSTYKQCAALLATPFARRFSRVELIRHDRNTGTHVSLNEGLAWAEGEFVAIINSDDLFHPQRLEKITAKMREKGSGLGFSLVDPFHSKLSKDKDADALETVPWQLFSLKQALDLERYATVGFSLLEKNVLISTGNMIVKTALARAVGGFDEFKYCHDWDFALKCLAVTEPVYVDEPLYLYRLHGMNSFRSYAHLAGLETEAILRRYFRGTISGTTNPQAPSADNWPGYFELMLQQFGAMKLWLEESREEVPSWRIYDQGTQKTSTSLYSTLAELLAAAYTDEAGRRRNLEQLEIIKLSHIVSIHKEASVDH